MFDKKLLDKINKDLHKNIDIIFKYNFNGLLFLYGDTLYNFIMNQKIIDYNFVVLVYDNDNVINFIKSNNLEYSYDNDAYKIIYNKKIINIKIVSDLCYVGNLSTDFIFYDVFRSKIIPLGIKQALLRNEIIDYGYVKDDINKKDRVKKGKALINYLNGNKKRVRLKRKRKYSSYNGNFSSKNILSKDLIRKLDNLIYEKFRVIYDYDFKGIVLLYGGTIRNLIMGIPIKDFDFVIFTQDECEILDFIRKHKLVYTKNAGGGYKILYDGFEIDMFSVDDLYVAGIYDMDMLIYDIHMHNFITCGSLRAIERRIITEVNIDKEPLYSNKFRIKKMINFIKHVSGSKKRVLVKQNNLLWEYKMFKKRIKLNINKITNGSIRKCFRFLRNCKREFILILVIGIILALSTVLFPMLSGKLITGLMNLDYHLVFMCVIFMILIKLVSIVFQFIFSKLYLVINKKMVFNIRKDIANSLFSFEMSNFTTNNRGTFIDKLKNDPNEITRIFNSIKDILVRGIGNLGVVFYIFYLDYRIGLVLLIFMFIIFEVKMIGIRKRRTYRFLYYSDQEKYSSLLGEMINGVHDIKGLDMKDNYIKRAVKSFTSVGENEFRGEYYQNIYNKIASFIELVAVFSMLLLGIYLVKLDMLEVSSLIIIYMYNSSVFSFLERFGLLVSLNSDLNVSCNRIFSLLDGNLYTKEVFGNRYKNKCLGNIEFKNISFKYKNKNNYVFKNCSFKIDGNETVAILGKSGIGKTTILNLIARLYTPDSGNLLLDNISICEYSEEYIRENISVISQSPYLFDMSIRDNFRLVDENISDSKIKEVCNIVCMDEFIESLPNGYNTVIGEGGIQLSNGQKQRLGIARALLKNTKIILLDEITSALDNETTNSIKGIINKIKKDHTIIIVTHELSMTSIVDKILVIEDDSNIICGTHNELLKKSKVYKKLYKLK